MKITKDNIEYNICGRWSAYIEALAWKGAEGADVTATVPAEPFTLDEVQPLFKDGNKIKKIQEVKVVESFGKSLKVGRVVIGCQTDEVKFEDCPFLTEVHFKGETKLRYHAFENCPNLTNVVVDGDLECRITTTEINSSNHITWRINGAVKCLDYNDKSGAFDFNCPSTVEFLDKAQGFLLGAGHYVLGEGVKEIVRFKKPNGDKPVGTHPQYGLPSMLELRSAVPPVIGHIEPGSITVAEVHVPKGAVQAYAKHEQWKKAAFITDDAGESVDNYAKKFRALQKEKEKQAKAEKLSALQSTSHKVIAAQTLAQWNGQVEEGHNDTTTATATITRNTQLSLSVDNKQPLDIWNSVSAYVASINSILQNGK